jgi:hypothetical protein
MSQTTVQRRPAALAHLTQSTFVSEGMGKSSTFQKHVIEKANPKLAQVLQTDASFENNPLAGLESYIGGLTNTEKNQAEKVKSEKQNFSSAFRTPALAVVLGAAVLFAGLVNTPSLLIQGAASVATSLFQPVPQIESKSESKLIQTMDYASHISSSATHDGILTTFYYKYQSNITLDQTYRLVDSIYSNSRHDGILLDYYENHKTVLSQYDAQALAEKVHSSSSHDYILQNHYQLIH